MVTINLGIDVLAVEFTFDARMREKKDRVSFYKKFYGFRDIQSEQRIYIRGGVLSDIRHLRPTKSTVIVSKKDASVVRRFLKSYPDVVFDEKLVVLHEGEAKALGLRVAAGWRRIYEELKGNENTSFSVDF